MVTCKICPSVYSLRAAKACVVEDRDPGLAILGKKVSDTNETVGDELIQLRPFTISLRCAHLLGGKALTPRASNKKHSSRELLARKLCGSSHTVQVDTGAPSPIFHCQKISTSTARL